MRETGLLRHFGAFAEESVGGYFYGAGVAAEGLFAFRGADDRAVLAVYPGIDVPC